MLRGHRPHAGEAGLGGRLHGVGSGFGEEVSRQGSEASCTVTQGCSRRWSLQPVTSQQITREVGGRPREILLPPQEGTCFQVKICQFTESSEVPKHEVL